jgi:hypothetical protein
MSLPGHWSLTILSSESRSSAPLHTPLTDQTVFLADSFVLSENKNKHLNMGNKRFLNVSPTGLTVDATYFTTRGSFCSLLTVLWGHLHTWVEPSICSTFKPPKTYSSCWYLSHFLHIRYCFGIVFCDNNSVHYCFGLMWPSLCYTIIGLRPATLGQNML